MLIGQVKDEKKICNSAGLLFVFFLLVVACYVFWVAQFTRGSCWGYILVGVVGAIIFIVGFYIIIRKNAAERYLKL